MAGTRYHEKYKWVCLCIPGIREELLVGIHGIFPLEVRPCLTDDIGKSIVDTRSIIPKHPLCHPRVKFHNLPVKFPRVDHNKLCVVHLWDVARLHLRTYFPGLRRGIYLAARGCRKYKPANFPLLALVGAEAFVLLGKTTALHYFYRCFVLRQADAGDLLDAKLRHDYRQKGADGLGSVAVLGIVPADVAADLPGAVLQGDGLHIADAGAAFQQHRVHQRAAAVGVNAHQKINGFGDVLHRFKHFIRHKPAVVCIQRVFVHTLRHAAVKFRNDQASCFDFHGKAPL